MTELMTDREQILQGFNSGVDCAQIVIEEFAPRFGVNRVSAMKAAAVFGGGMWEGETCGAVIGALMAIGLKYGQSYNANQEQKELMLQKADLFKKRFSEKYGSCTCKEILGYKIPEDLDTIIEEDLFKTKCASLVVDACIICNEVMSEE